MFLEQRTVSRKTAGDGRLEITKEAAAYIQQLVQPFLIDVAGDRVPGTLGSFACTCRGAANPHVHFFLESDRLKVLAAGDSIDVDIEPKENRVIIRPR